MFVASVMLLDNRDSVLSLYKTINYTCLLKFDTLPNYSDNGTTYESHI